MKIHLYALCRNEARILPYFFKNYDGWVDRYIIFYEDSTDATLSLLEAHGGIDIRSFRRPDPNSYVISQKILSDTCWKESRNAADWVVIVDIDEHLDHSNILDYLSSCQRSGVTIIPARGYQMLSKSFPTCSEKLSLHETFGAPWAKMCKLAVFDPNAISDIDFEFGRHTAALSGRVIRPRFDELKLLHYKYLGVDYIVDRFAALKEGLGTRDISNRWLGKYSWNRNEIESHWNQFARRAISLDSLPKVMDSAVDGMWWSAYPDVVVK